MISDDETVAATPVADEPSTTTTPDPAPADKAAEPAASKSKEAEPSAKKEPEAKREAKPDPQAKRREEQAKALKEGRDKREKAEPAAKTDAEPAKAEAAKTPAGEQVKAAAEPGKTPTADAPKFLPETLRGKWGAVPKELQDFFAKTTGKADQAIAARDTQLKERNAAVESWKPMRDLIEKHGRTFDAYKMHPHDLFDKMMEAQDQLERMPAFKLTQFIGQYKDALAPHREAFIAKVAETLGVDIGQLAITPPTGTIPAPDPQIEAIRKRNGELEREARARAQGDQQTQIQTQAQARQGLQESLGQFVEAKGLDAFAAVQDDFAAEYRILKDRHPNATDNQLFEAAFERAQYANPDARNRIVEERIKKHEADQKAARAEQDVKAAAKRASDMTVTGNAESQPNQLTKRQEQRAALQRARKRQDEGAAIY